MRPVRATSWTEDDSRTIWAECNAINVSFVSPQGEYFLSVLHVPDLDDAIFATASNSRSIRTECDAEDGGFVTFESENFLTVLGIPDPDGVVVARRRQAAD